jgi:hypothetical protein
MKFRLLIVCLLLTKSTLGDTQAVLIGGGYKLESSQGQIEENVSWLKTILPQHVKSLNVFFGSGTDSRIHDVVYWDTTARKSTDRNPLADVFDSPSSEWVRYRHNSINPDMGSASKSNLVSNLNNLLPKVDADNFLLVYNGHGGYGGLNKTLFNSLLLWDHSELNVQEFRDLLNLIPEQTTKRFVLTQCFSGGFYDAVINNHQVSANRCGFMADAENLEAEGCELGINKDDFRDYTTYFFAALNGTSRYGEPLILNPDKDGNAKISFQEAHFYALEAALSSDLSRSTSEIFLERWQPWYLRWQNFSSAIDNHYAKLVKSVSTRYSVNPEDLTTQRSGKEADLEKIKLDKNLTQEKIISLKKSIAEKVTLIYPFLSHPFTQGYTMGIQENESAIRSAITELDEYPKLVEALNEMETLFTKELQTKREITQIEKVRRLQRLSVLEDSFHRFANDTQAKQYESLLNCEKGYLD